MIAATTLQLVLVTPETTLVDEPVKSIRLPLQDGSIGLLPGRAPVVGRLGIGELQFDAGQGSQQYFIDGGFLQVKGQVVTVLTNKAITVGDIDPTSAEGQLTELRKMVATTAEQQAEKAEAEERSRRMIAMKRRG